MSDMTHLYVWHDSFICVTRLIHTHRRCLCLQVWRDSFICVTCLIRMCDMTHLYVWHDSFICVTWLIHTQRRCLCLHRYRGKRTWFEYRNPYLSACHCPTACVAMFVVVRVAVYVAVCVAWESKSESRQLFAHEQSLTRIRCAAVCCSVLQRVAVCCSANPDNCSPTNNRSHAFSPGSPPYPLCPLSTLVLTSWDMCKSAPIFPQRALFLQRSFAKELYFWNLCHPLNARTECLGSWGCLHFVTGCVAVCVAVYIYSHIYTYTFIHVYVH